MRRFLRHVLPEGYGLLANAGRSQKLARIRELLVASPTSEAVKPPDEQAFAGMTARTFLCPCCGAAMIAIETLACGHSIRAQPVRRDGP